MNGIGSSPAWRGHHGALREKCHFACAQIAQRETGIGLVGKQIETAFYEPRWQLLRLKAEAVRLPTRDTNVAVNLWSPSGV